MPSRIIADVMDYGRFRYRLRVRVRIFLWAPPWKCHEQPLKARLCVCVLSACIVAPISRSANANISLFFCPCLKAELAGFHAIEKGLGGWGREDGPQLLSDVNAAQTLCVCGHSRFDSSNQLMGYLTVPPLRPPDSLLLGCKLTVEPQQTLGAQWRSACKTATVICLEVFRLRSRSASEFELCVQDSNAEVLAEAAFTKKV